ncbi:MAG: 2-succinyl-5-enolpyruvyl-6-hydroxy-3-cyclohexene-1-carboxylic-acid synthase [Candidatus Dormibacteraeota bacterium]|nr:2-succinyl-5-enolpyruvyl-6-hydroxy-3-cyclohexene-1-carboxylic-acid synthase [Candidatus Dormibacteraeota bacterium]
MSEGEVTQAFAATFVDELARCGLRHACVAPGSRSAPLAMAFARHPGVKVWVHIDERSAAFFALGLAKAEEWPVALLCTSGTAAAEFHPAVLEASYSRTPLLVLTADRPPELRDVGANQAVEQNRLYGSAPRWFFDAGLPDDDPAAPRRWRRLAARALAETRGELPGPVHLNLPFREPLSPKPGRIPRAEPVVADPLWLWRGAAQPSAELVDRIATALARADRPLLVAGEMRDGARLRHALDALLARLDAPLLAEPTSQLRRRAGLGVVESYDALLRDPSWARAHVPDLVLRLGAPSTSKALNQFLLRYHPRTILIDEAGGWRDPDLLAAEIVRCDPLPLLEQLEGKLREGDGIWQHVWRDASVRALAALDRKLYQSPLHEGHVVRALASELPEPATVFAGSSLAIRDVDAFWPGSAPGVRFLANRGASGIDGLVSTGLGAAAADAGTPTVLLLGDLSLYHDMNGLWAAKRHGLRAVIVVLDNNGGGIFDYLPPAQHADVFEELFTTPLGLRLEDVALLYDLYFCAVSDPGDLPYALERALLADRSTLVCARFSREQSLAGHQACWAAVTEALR